MVHAKVDRFRGVITLHVESALELDLIMDHLRMKFIVRGVKWGIYNKRCIILH